MEAAASSEMVVSSYQATEGGNIQLTLQESKVSESADSLRKQLLVRLNAVRPQCGLSDTAAP